MSINYSKRYRDELSINSLPQMYLILNFNHAQSLLECSDTLLAFVEKSINEE